MKGLKIVDEAEFEKLVEDLDESISGSDSEELSSEEEEGATGKESTLTALLKKQAKISDPQMDEEIRSKRVRGAGKPPLLWFGSSALPPEVSLGVYRAVFTEAEQEEEAHLIETVKKKQLTPIAPAKRSPNQGGVPLPVQSASPGPHFFLCMIGGGHFAAMVVSLAPKVTKKHNVEERQATVVAHKTFHRYTTRRKQGGAQSASDSTKGPAHSAGSSLRRYNEVALTNEVRELLGQWKDMIDSADFLFIRATGKTNRSTLFGTHEGQVLRQNDPRIRGFPFNTRRATQAELMRSFVELTRVKVSRVDEAALAAAAAAQASKEASKPGTPTPSKPKPSKPARTEEEEAAILHTTQLISLIRRSKAPALLSYLTSNNLSPSFHFVPEDAPQHHHTPTPLHLAASIGSSVVVLALLTKAQADPSVDNGEGKPAFALASDRSTRDAFRVARATLGEALWDWDAAGVPPPLSKADADAREQRERREADAKEADRRKAETERLRQESVEQENRAQERKFGKGKVLSAAAAAATAEKTGAEKREEEMRGMTPEMRMRLERERRARAAEERLRRMQGGGSSSGSR